LKKNAFGLLVLLASGLFSERPANCTHDTFGGNIINLNCKRGLSLFPACHAGPGFHWWPSSVYAQISSPAFLPALSKVRCTVDQQQVTGAGRGAHQKAHSPFTDARAGLTRTRSNWILSETEKPTGEVQRASYGFIYRAKVTSIEQTISHQHGPRNPALTGSLNHPPKGRTNV